MSRESHLRKSIWGLDRFKSYNVNVLRASFFARWMFGTCKQDWAISGSFTWICCPNPKTPPHWQCCCLDVVGGRWGSGWIGNQGNRNNRATTKQKAVPRETFSRHVLRAVGIRIVVFTLFRCRWQTRFLPWTKRKDALVLVRPTAAPPSHSQLAARSYWNLPSILPTSSNSSSL